MTETTSFSLERKTEVNEQREKNINRIVKSFEEELRERLNDAFSKLKHPDFPSVVSTHIDISILEIESDKLS